MQVRMTPSRAIADDCYWDISPICGARYPTRTGTTTGCFDRTNNVRFFVNTGAGRAVITALGPWQGNLMSNTIKDQIRQALIMEWDPIGVRDIPEAQDEYDAYVLPIYEMLAQENSICTIIDYLWWLETDYMGLQGKRSATELFAQRLVNIWDNREGLARD